MKELIEHLEREFKHTPSYTLCDITKKIAIISKVRDSRHGQVLTYEEYDEVTPKTTDIFGVVVPSSRGEVLGKANARVIKAQALNEGDLLISYRGKYGYPVARVGSGYRRTIVGNNSTIRIQFIDNIEKEMPVLIQEYFQQDYVQEYLIRCSLEAKLSRQLINAEMLKTLPLPDFRKSSDITFLEFHNKRLNLVATAKSINKTAQEIVENLTAMATKDLALHTNSPQLLKELSKKDEEILEYLKGVMEKLSSFSNR